MKDVKKPRLEESSETYEEDNNIEILDTENIIAENRTINSGELSEGKVGDKDHTKGLKDEDTEVLKQEDKIMQDLLDMHEDVPLGDPGPNTASEDGEDGVAGATL